MDLFSPHIEPEELVEEVPLTEFQKIKEKFNPGKDILVISKEAFTNLEAEDKVLIKDSSIIFENNLFNMAIIHV